MTHDLWRNDNKNDQDTSCRELPSTFHFFIPVWLSIFSYYISNQHDIYIYTYIYTCIYIYTQIYIERDVYMCILHAHIPYAESLWCLSC